MPRSLVLLLCLSFAGPLPGCYYTATSPDGSTQRISREEYERLRGDERTSTRVRVPTLLD